MNLPVEPHPSLVLAAFHTVWPTALEAIESSAWLAELLVLGAPAPVQRREELRACIRDMLRHGGYKPTGRGKPASEYLATAAAGDGLRRINAAVDVANAVSLHSGFPVSVVDLDRLAMPMHVGIASAGSQYVFNEAGQEIDVEGLLCLHDAHGPCANAVKDAQRTKTVPSSTRTLSLVWGAEQVRPELERATAWYRELSAKLGAVTATVTVERRG